MDSILYLGLDPARYPKKVIHLPMIKIKPRYFTLNNYDEVTHLVFTSRSAVSIFCDRYSISNKKVIVIGKATAQCVEEQGATVDYIAKIETAEGVIELLESLKPKRILLPHAARSRRVLLNYLLQRSHVTIPIYDTELLHYDNPPNLEQFTEIVFTSPSTVEAYFNQYHHIPEGVKVTAIGPITRKALCDFDIKKKSC